MLLLGRELTSTEQRYSEAEKALTILHWGIRKSARYTAHNPKLTLTLRSLELKLLAHDSSVHARIRAKVLDLGSYNVKYEVSETNWDLGGKLGQLMITDTEALEA